MHAMISEVVQVFFNLGTLTNRWKEKPLRTEEKVSTMAFKKNALTHFFINFTDNNYHKTIQLSKGKIGTVLFTTNRKNKGEVITWVQQLL